MAGAIFDPYSIALLTDQSLQDPDATVLVFESESAFVRVGGWKSDFPRLSSHPPKNGSVACAIANPLAAQPTWKKNSHFRTHGFVVHNVSEGVKRKRKRRAASLTRPNYTHNMSSLNFVPFLFLGRIS
jgi:hypothetical protein